ncbi:UNVERIFIED_CONTAM: hypothetical protein [Bacteriophage sp.]
MFTLLTTVVSFLSGGVPKLLDFFQDRADKKHELELARMQTERELTLKKAGLEAQERIEHIQTEQIQINADVANTHAALEERQSLYAHDIAIGQGASTWVVNARAMVRPAITYGMFIMFVFVEVFGFIYAFKTGVSFDVALNQLWDDDTQTIWASIVSFWFGTQAFSKK